MPLDHKEADLAAGPVHGICHLCLAGLGAFKERRDIDQRNNATPDMLVSPHAIPDHAINPMHPPARAQE